MTKKWKRGVLGIAAMLGGALTASAAIEVAGTLYVDFDATGLPAGPVTSVVNNGSLGGVFDSIGTYQTRVVPVGSAKGVNFDSKCWMANKTASGGSYIAVPSSLLGANPHCSIEVWAYNPTVEWEEAMVGWGTRGPNNGNNMVFMYSSNPDYGAVGHWGGQDLGWNPTPAQAQWHHLVYTYDGTVCRVYSDGVLNNSETQGSLNTLGGPAIVLGAEWNQSLNVDEPNLNGSLVMAKARVHSGVLTDAQILNNYDQEKGNFYIANTGTSLPKAPVHRYSFNNTAGNASGQSVSDVGTPGGADATVKGSPASFTGTKVSLGGGSSATAAYVDLPNGLVSTLSANNGGPGKVTLEGWVTETGAQSWARIFDIGTTTIGEIANPGQTGNGVDYIMLSAQIGTDTSWKRFEYAGSFTYDIKSYSLGTPVHFVMTWDEASNEIIVYLNGDATARIVATRAMSAVNDVNVWLGRSNWTADNNLQGDFDEFRIYDYVLTAENVMKNYLNGPDVIQLAGEAIQVAATAATDVGPQSATLNGKLVTASAPTDVTFYYGTTDGGTDPGAWAASTTLSGLGLGDFSAPVSGLALNTQYFYRCYGVNTGGEAWSDVMNFTTLGVGTIENLTPKGLTANSALAVGKLSNTNGLPTTVRVYWGSVDGGTEETSWESNEDLGTKPPGTYSPKLAGLSPDTTYYYRFMIENAEKAWASSTMSFRTAPLFDPSGFSYTLDFTASGYTKTEALIDFPLLVTFSTGIKSFSYDQLQAGAADLRFTDASGAELKFEVDTWNPMGTSYVWVQVPELTTDCIIRAYFGNAGAAAPTYTTDGTTWSDDFIAVWHMNEAMVKDSTAHGWNATAIVNPAVVSSTSGMLGTAQHYNGSAGNPCTTIGDIKLTDHTLSAWALVESGGWESTFMARDGDLWFYDQYDHYRYETAPWGNDNSVMVASVNGVGRWVYMVGTSEPDPNNPANCVQKLYIDGEQLVGSWSKQYPNFTSSAAFTIASRADGWRPMLGSLDELRAEKTTRSASWVWACFQNQKTPAAFLPAGEVNYIGPLDKIVLTVGSATAIGTTSATLNGTLVSGTTATSWGTVWDTTPAPTANVQAETGTPTLPQAISQARTGFTPGTHYYYRVWGTADGTEIVYSGDGEFYTEPEVAMDVTFSDVKNVAMTVSWVAPASSSGSVVVMKKGAPVTAAPVDGTTYTANSFLGLGPELAAGEYVVYAGSGNSVTVNGLYPDTTYHVAIYTYAGSGALLQYQSTPAAGSQITGFSAASMATAGEMLIDLSILRGVETNEASQILSWTNFGTLGGVFVADGSDSTRPGYGDTFGLPSAVFGGIGEGNHVRASFPAPAGITGTAPNFSVELWMLNPSIANEEWLFGWARGWTCKRHAGIGYGNNAAFGVVAHWCDPDMGFDGGVPPAGVWHHVVITMDSSTMLETVYVDGVQNAQELKQDATSLDIWPGDPVTLGNTLNGDTDLTYRTDLGFSGSVNALRMHSAALTAEQVLNNYLVGPHAPITTVPEAPTAKVGISGEDVIITFNTVPGLLYTVQYADTLPASGWNEVFPGPQVATGSTMSVPDTGGASASTQRFYRVVQQW